MPEEINPEAMLEATKETISKLRDNVVELRIVIEHESIVTGESTNSNFITSARIRFAT